MTAKVLKDLFTPIKNIDKQTMKILVATQLVGLLILWFMSPFVFLPTPKEILGAFQEMWGQGLAVNLLVSLKLSAEAVTLTALLSLGAAYLSTLPFFQPAVSLIGKLRFLSMAGLVFFFKLMTSNGHQLKLSLLVFAVLVFFVTGMLDVIAGIPKEYFDLARTLRMGHWRMLWEVVILGQADKAFDVLRQNAAIGWMMLTMVESMSRSEGGIGAMMMTEDKHFNLAAVFAIQIVILALGILQDYGIGALKRMCCPYAELTLEKK